MYVTVQFCMNRNVRNLRLSKKRGTFEREFASDPDSSPGARVPTPNINFITQDNENTQQNNIAEKNGHFLINSIVSLIKTDAYAVLGNVGHLQGGSDRPLDPDNMHLKGRYAPKTELPGRSTYDLQRTCATAIRITTHIFSHYLHQFRFIGSMFCFT
ncbi:MAG: hypothetical protein KFF77_08940 [Bacteroidetes bacterium]|nr:hypothetical protein [Bacteroidota bacterium]